MDSNSFKHSDWLALGPTPHTQHTVLSAQHSVCLSVQYPGPSCEAAAVQWSSRLLFLSSPGKEITSPHLSDQQIFLRAKKWPEKNAGGRKRERRMDYHIHQLKIGFCWRVVSPGGTSKETEQQDCERDVETHISISNTENEL